MLFLLWCIPILRLINVCLLPVTCLVVCDTPVGVYIQSFWRQAAWFVQEVTAQKPSRVLFHSERRRIITLSTTIQHNYSTVSNSKLILTSHWGKAECFCFHNNQAWQAFFGTPHVKRNLAQLVELVGQRIIFSFLISFCGFVELTLTLDLHFLKS